MILVTGAGGTVGTALVEALNAGKHEFRAAYHSPDKADKSRLAGQDAVELDFAEPTSLPPAFDGVETLFLLGAGIRGQVEREINVVDAARAASVKKLVKLSAWGAAEEQYDIARMHRRIEVEVEASGMAWTFLRPNGFMQNFANHMAPVIRANNAISQPAADASISFIDVRDIASVAVQALTASGHDNKAYELSGPQGLSYEEVADILSAMLGRTIDYVALTDEAARAGMVETGMPEFYAAAMVDLVRAYRGGIAAKVTADVERVTGRKPISFAQFAQDYADRWR